MIEDGSLIINEVGKNGTIIKLNKCGKLIKFNKTINTHHCLEIDDEGYIYTPTLDKNFNIKEELHPSDFAPDGFAILDKELNILQNISLLEIYLRNNLLGDIYGNQVLLKDPFHLNDVEPYISPNGENFVLLSMKGHSRVMALNLETLKVNWFIDRATLLQDDVDVLYGDNEKISISIFDNNSRMYGEGYSSYQNYGNKIAFLENLPLKSSFPISIGDYFQHKKYNLNYLSFNLIKKDQRPKTRNEGLSDINYLNNSVMIEETNFGRLLEVDLLNGKILWQFYNKTDNKPPFMMNWSRRLVKLPSRVSEDIFKECQL